MTRKNFIDMADTLVGCYTYGHIRGNKFKLLMKEMIGFCKRNGRHFDEAKFRNYVEDKLKAYDD